MRPNTVSSWKFVNGMPFRRARSSNERTCFASEPERLARTAARQASCSPVSRWAPSSRATQNLARGGFVTESRRSHTEPADGDHRTRYLADDFFERTPCLGEFARVCGKTCLHHAARAALCGSGIDGNRLVAEHHKPDRSDRFHVHGVAAVQEKFFGGGECDRSEIASRSTAGSGSR
jgi:hypothetical protein